jgi:hypothetical protein
MGYRNMSAIIKRMGHLSVVFRYCLALAALNGLMSVVRLVQRMFGISTSSDPNAGLEVFVQPILFARDFMIMSLSGAILGLFMGISCHLALRMGRKYQWSWATMGAMAGVIFTLVYALFQKFLYSPLVFDHYLQWIFLLEDSILVMLMRFMQIIYIFMQPIMLFIPSMLRIVLPLAIFVAVGSIMGTAYGYIARKKTKQNSQVL